MHLMQYVSYTIVIMHVLPITYTKVSTRGKGSNIEINMLFSQLHLQ